MSHRSALHSAPSPAASRCLAPHNVASSSHSPTLRSTSPPSSISALYNSSSLSRSSAPHDVVPMSHRSALHSAPSPAESRCLAPHNVASPSHSPTLHSTPPPSGSSALYNPPSPSRSLALNVATLPSHKPAPNIAAVSRRSSPGAHGRTSQNHCPPTVVDTRRPSSSSVGISSAKTSQSP